MTLLKTYMQISDLHFVDTAQRVVFDPWAQHVPLLAGFVGHSDAALRYLQSAFNRLCRRDPETELIVTGDLTAYGATDQFRDADTYLGNAPTYPEFLGLNRPDWSKLSVPGNHDFWPGVALVSLGHTNREVRRRYPRNVDITRPLVLPSGQQVVFLCLNSDADVRPFSRERFYAVGDVPEFVERMR
jgi:3',5'-cyclic AMP phosphodiesterase CpdA